MDLNDGSTYYHDRPVMSFPSPMISTSLKTDSPGLEATENIPQEPAAPFDVSHSEFAYLRVRR